MAAKTKKYYMEIDSYATQTVRIELSKSQYEQTKERYVSIVEENHAMYSENDTEWYLDVKETKNENDQVVVTVLMICDGATYIVLRKEECKPGYHFKTKKEKRGGKKA